MADRSDKRWRPVRRGTIYCSPACGFQCTHADFVLATEKGEALARRMGPGWKPYVWENCKWHYSVQLGMCEIHVNGPRRYWVNLQTPQGQFCTDATSPKKGYEKTLEMLALAINGLQTVLDDQVLAGKAPTTKRRKEHG